MFYGTSFDWANDLYPTVWIKFADPYQLFFSLPLIV